MVRKEFKKNEIMRSIKTLPDVVDWGLCTGCGACCYFCDKQDVVLENILSVGIRPRFNRAVCKTCTDCLDICPGCRIDVENDKATCNESLLIGPALKIMEGHAVDESIRFKASSGGALTAIALYCLEKENFSLVLHSGMDSAEPWKNHAKISRSREELLQHTGSRYLTSSPCESLHLIEESDRPAVFIGKPCDAAAVSKLRKKRPKLDRNLGLVLSFFCAGTPSSRATLDLLKKLDFDLSSLASLYYRGNGWPGGFTTVDNSGRQTTHLTYRDSWHFLQKYRPFRCHLCPDGLGQTADISCGDAWHRYQSEKKNPGLSLILARNLHGRQILEKAILSGYLNAEESKAGNVIKAQGLVERRKEIFGRVLAMKLLGIPVTDFSGFNLFRCWLMASGMTKIKSVFGTIRRLIQRGLWHGNPLM